MIKAYNSWHVTTEGDCEGKSIKDLGVHVGFFDEIAFALADKAFYELHMSPAKEKPEIDITPKAASVMVSLPIETKTWDLKGADRRKYYEKFLAGRPVKFGDKASYAGIELINTKYKDTIRIAALAKLTKEEKEILGVK